MPINGINNDQKVGDNVFVERIDFSVALQMGSISSSLPIKCRIVLGLY